MEFGIINYTADIVIRQNFCDNVGITDLFIACACGSVVGYYLALALKSRKE